MSNLNLNTFNKRLRQFYTIWQNSSDENNFDALAVVSGTEPEGSYYKTNSIQHWLFGLEIPDTAILFLDKLVVFISRAETIAFFEQVNTDNKNEQTPMFMFIDSEVNKSYLKDAIQLIQISKHGKKLGIFPNERFKGEFFSNCKQTIDGAKCDKIDAGPLVASILAVKDEIEIGLIKMACKYASEIFSKILRDQIIKIVENEQNVTHQKLREAVEGTINDAIYEPNMIESCYPAIIQSGGSKSLDNNLHYGSGSIICALGIRFNKYCSNIVRTVLVDPSETIKENYKYLLALEEELIASLSDGVKLSDLYAKIKAKCRKERPDLVGKLTNYFGYLIGIELRETTFIICKKCSKIAKSGMVFHVRIGLSNLKNPDDAGKNYALFIGDTVLVAKDEGATVLTVSEKKMENIFIKKTAAETRAQIAEFEAKLAELGQLQAQIEEQNGRLVDMASRLKPTDLNVVYAHTLGNLRALLAHFLDANKRFYDQLSKCEGRPGPGELNAVELANVQVKAEDQTEFRREENKIPSTSASRKRNRVVPNWNVDPYRYPLRSGANRLLAMVVERPWLSTRMSLSRRSSFS